MRQILKYWIQTAVLTIEQFEQTLRKWNSFEKSCSRNYLSGIVSQVYKKAKITNNDFMLKGLVKLLTSQARGDIVMYQFIFWYCLLKLCKCALHISQGISLALFHKTKLMSFVRIFQEAIHHPAPGLKRIWLRLIILTTKRFCSLLVFPFASQNTKIISKGRKLPDIVSGMKVRLQDESLRYALLERI